MIEAFTVARQKAVRLSLLNPTGRTRHLLEITGLARIVETFDSEAAALASCETVEDKHVVSSLLSGDQLTAGCVAAIRSQFAIAILMAGEPTGAGLFVTSREIPDVTEPSDAVPASAEDAVYFSPAAVTAVREMIADFRTMPSR